MLLYIDTDVYRSNVNPLSDLLDAPGRNFRANQYRKNIKLLQLIQLSCWRRYDIREIDDAARRDAVDRPVS